VFKSACHIDIFEVVCSFNGFFMQKKKKKKFGLFNDNECNPVQLVWTLDMGLKMYKIDFNCEIEYLYSILI